MSPQSIIALAAEKMKQDFKKSIIHDRHRVNGAAEVACQRYEVVGQARHSPLITLPPPRWILFPSPIIHTLAHPKHQKTPEAKLVMDATKRLRNHIKRELKSSINIVSASVNVAINLTIASMVRNYDLDIDIYTQSRTGVERLQQLVSPGTVEFHFGILPDGPIFFAQDMKVNNFVRAVPIFYELQRTLCHTIPTNNNRHRRVYYFSNSSSEEQFLFAYSAQSKLEGKPVEYLDDLIAIAKSRLEEHDWIIIWEPLASLLVQQSKDTIYGQLHDVEPDPFQIIVWLLGAQRLVNAAPEFIRDFVYVLSSEWDYLMTNEAVALEALGRSRDILESFLIGTAHQLNVPKS